MAILRTWLPLACLPPAAQRSLLEPEYDNALACIRCGLCLTACPTYQLTLEEAESPRGRIAMARALIEGHLGVTPDLVAHLGSCLLCQPIHEFARLASRWSISAFRSARSLQI